MLDIRYGQSRTPVPTQIKLTTVGSGVPDRPLITNYALRIPNFVFPVILSKKHPAIL